MIVLRNMAKVVLPEEHRREVLELYWHTSRSGDTVKNYKYADGVAYLPLNPTKLKLVARLLNEEILDQRSTGETLSTTWQLVPTFQLRPHQESAAPALLHEVLVNQYAVIEAGCGLGKTVVMSWAAGRLGVKILVLVDMGSLVSQWQDAFLMVWGIKPQVLKRGDTRFADVCVATFQMLHANPELLALISKVFGCLLVDEFHTSQSNTRREVLFRLDNAFRIGCTATPWKKGYQDDVLTDLIADVSVIMKDEQALKPEVHFVPTGVRFCSNNPDDWGKIQSELSKNEQRNLIAYKLILNLVAEGRKILVIGLTIAQCRMLARNLERYPKCRPKVFTGSTSMTQDRQLREDVRDGKVNTVLTVKKFDKGTDVPELDCLVAIKPHNNEAFLEQTSGRIERKLEGKLHPVIYDLEDSGKLAERFAKNRLKWYSQRNYSIGAPIAMH